MTVETLRNYVGGRWVDSASLNHLEVTNPATGEVLARVPLSTREEVDSAVRAARAAYPEWRATAPLTRARYFFRLKDLLEERFEDIARTLVREEGKTLDEARGEVRRAIECVEATTGIPSLMMGTCLEDAAKDIDTVAVRQPIGVFAMLAPFNFPAMVPMWFLPFAVACGNTFIIKPSEQVPLCQMKILEAMDEVGFPPGVVNLVHGARDVAEALIEHPGVNGISFVGRSAVARQIYRRAAEFGKRVQALGGAKNFLVVMPDADLGRTVPALITSCFGCAGERCLSGSVILAVGETYDPLQRRVVDAASRLRVGDPLDETVQMGPVISRRHTERVLRYIDQGLQEGAKLLLDGRGVIPAGSSNGYFIGATIFAEVRPEMTIAREEIFGPVIGIIPVRDLEEALGIIRANEYGNTACIFTESGRSAAEFVYRAECSMLGINVGIAAPMAFFPFGGIKGSLFGDLKATGRAAIEFFTDTKVVISRWR
ncbi:MAG: CoA-acylating methylmalonate-semialdehyde dehydrogenase [Candidatus Rokubacteria bacterium]|nr:CoA-acylating methylmalonate-semialdehyde dehydrogenase [Candidatus Rokubacteria bacterium]